ncbi:unnamed protein product (macronuclear) [Paramecium tetraurelia]|uniref:Cyclic nucleotide-binding domain-containing protein n=1 Tax=Paramecium tetraurelia TaxID=5888 RepID=A0BTP0_PARTE|nr:uncharacterized protein GSPATT00032139001 [Paramecium tetraurelia]CAK61907.1 unnamed protein product [Paramecium tetraurelia]|eukprot:XP_001429305.1 hypothetical protein (macronuclear) [Paramecium tetraurelia strain d4-2]
MRLQRNHQGAINMLKTKIESYEHRHKQHILCQLFPDTPIKWIKPHLDKVIFTSYHLNQTLFCKNQKPTHVYFIIEGEVRLEETQIERRKPQNAMFASTCMAKSRTLLIISAGSLVGEIEALHEKPYQTTAKSNVHYSKILLIPEEIYIDLKKQDESYQSTETQHLKDQLILKKINQLKSRLELQEVSPERDSSPQTKISREDFIVQQNKRIQKKKNFEFINLTPEAPLFSVKKLKRVAAPDDKPENRARSISAPTKAKMLTTMKSIEKISKPEEITRSRANTINFGEKCRPASRIFWQQIFQKL